MLCPVLGNAVHFYARLARRRPRYSAWIGRVKKVVDSDGSTPKVCLQVRDEKVFGAYPISLRD